ncbi:hypothetical protein FHW36_1011006 [Chitinophaga polysaccharea]|uniref:Uncharacterized protein n=1 Tax=Chitinophaga polysaccharea TaxID=1293035 RepID=A0A561Q3Y6_9BACT|nr:hypothetical protein [Chitinophaga polysaccharea]TWF45080.1 hypothetical protein FHW36_1011006 [Chitinophaga polysaccharea]
MNMTTPTEELHQQLNSWKEEVNEVRTEVKMMRERLEQIALSKASRDVMTKVEHFENRLLRQREVADEMYHDLKQCAKKVSNAPVTAVHDDRPIDDYDTMQHRMEIFQKLYISLKEEFNDFMPCEV